MAKRLYVGNSPPIAQVDRLTIPKGQYLKRHIAEGSTLQVTINSKTLEARAPYLELGYGDLDDSKATEALLQDLYDQWTGSSIPEFLEIQISQPQQDEGENWYVEFTAKVAGVPFTITANAPFPTVDVDTIRDGAVGTDAEFTFEIDPVATGGNFIIQWDLGSGVETSTLIPYPIPSADAVKTAIVAGMASIGPDDIEVTVAAGVYTLKLMGAMSSTVVEVPEIITTNLTGGGQVFSATIRDGNSGTVTDTFSGGSSHLLSSHTSDTGQGWTVSGTNAAWLYVNGGKLLPGLAYTGGSYNFDHNSKAVSQYDGVTDAMANVAISNWGIYDWWLNHVNHGTGIGDGFYEPVLAMAYTAGIKLHTRHSSDNDTVYLHVTIAPEDNGGRAAMSMTPGATGKTGTMTVAIKKVVGGTTTTIATSTVDRDFATWQYDGSNHVYATTTGGGSGVASGNLIAPLEDSSMTLDIKVASGTVTGHVVDSTGVTTTVSGSLSTFTGTGKSYGMSFDFSTDSQATTFITTYPLTLDNFGIIDANDPDERQKLWTNGAGGTFDASDADDIETATGISATIARGALEDRLEEIYGVGGISVYGGSGTPADPWLLRFIGTNAATNMGQIKGDGSNLTGIAQATVVTKNLGSPGVTEQWSIAIIGASGGTITPRFRGIDATIDMPWDGDAGDLEDSLQSIIVQDEDGDDIALDVTVTGSGTTSDPFIATLGTAYEGRDEYQLIMLPDDLTGSDFPSFTHNTVQASHGPWHADDVLNWINADTKAYGIPTNGDSWHFEFGDQLHCIKYDIDKPSLTIAGIYVNGGFSSNATIGIPRWNPLGYYEYRDTELRCQLITPFSVIIGAGGGGGSPLIQLNAQTTKALITLHMTSSPLTGEKGAFQFRSTHADTEIEQLGGFLAVAPYTGQVATVKKFTQRGGSAYFGHGVTLGDAVRSGGTWVCDRIAMGGNTLEIH